jgi:hypothetical protein
MAEFLHQQPPNKPKPMKTNLRSAVLVTAVLSASTLFSQVNTRISIANGNWNNPSIWSPAGVPTLADDTIIINTDVTFNQSIADGQAMFRVNAGASLVDIGNDTAAFGGDRLVIDGYFSCYVLAVGMADSATVSGKISVANNFGQSDLFIVKPGGEVCVGQQLMTNDDFRNSGSVKTNNWINIDLVTGSGGKFCVQNYFINNGSISGMLDICDATPNTPYDVNQGTIAGTVTNCANGPCGNCVQPTAINEISAEAGFAIFPNPAVSSMTIRFNPGLIIPGETELVVYDFAGKEVRRFAIENESLEFARKDLAGGVYFCTVLVYGQPVASEKLVLN